MSKNVKNFKSKSVRKTETEKKIKTKEINVFGVTIHPLSSQQTTSSRRQVITLIEIKIQKLDND